jgi:hypothetical protein
MPRKLMRGVTPAAELAVTRQGASPMPLTEYAPLLSVFVTALPFVHATDTSKFAAAAPVAAIPLTTTGAGDGVDTGGVAGGGVTLTGTGLPPPPPPQAASIPAINKPCSACPLPLLQPIVAFTNPAVQNLNCNLAMLYAFCQLKGQACCIKEAKKSPPGDCQVG